MHGPQLTPAEAARNSLIGRPRPWSFAADDVVLAGDVLEIWRDAGCPPFAGGGTGIAPAPTAPVVVDGIVPNALNTFKPIGYVAASGGTLDSGTLVVQPL